MNFLKCCESAVQLLEELKTVVGELDNDVVALEEAVEDETLLVRILRAFAACNRLSGELLYEAIPPLEQGAASVGIAMRLAHDELMKRVRGAHTDVEVYTKVKRCKPQRQLLHAV